MIGPDAIACAAYGKEISLLARMTDLSHPSRSAIQSQMQRDKSKPVTSIALHVVVRKKSLSPGSEYPYVDLTTYRLAVANLILIISAPSDFQLT